MKKTHPPFSRLFLFSIFILLNACTVVYKQTGDVLISYAEDEGIPYILATEDVAFGCSMVESFSPFLLSFSRVTTSPEQLAILFYLVAGNCTEIKAWEEELRYLRAIHAKNAIEAQDARIAQQRYLAQASKRQFKGYHYLNSAYSESEGECPVLNTKDDEFYWLLGLVSGLQSLLNDIASAGTVEVPLNIASKIGRASTCLNNETWWGIPQAIQATIALTIPSDKSADKNPKQALTQSLEIAKKQGIKLTHILAAQVYLGLGDKQKVKQIIRDTSKMTRQTPENKAYKILNEVANLQMQQFSDRLWTEATGKRTPIGKLGSFWDDATQAVDIIEIDDML